MSDALSVVACDEISLLDIVLSGCVLAMGLLGCSSACLGGRGSHVLVYLSKSIYIKRKKSNKKLILTSSSMDQK